MFHVGQKVECINVDPLGIKGVNGRVTEYIRRGGIYTIKWVGECPFEPWRHFGLNLRLVGIVRPDHENLEWCDFPFLASRFRPIVERKTGIGVLTALLEPANHKRFENA